MKASNGPVILIVTCAAIFAICWFTITALTTPARAIGSGAALSLLSGLFLWFAQTDRHAIARGIISVGATAVAAPFAAMQALMNETLFSYFESHGPTSAQMIAWDDMFAMGWTMMSGGAAVLLICLIVGGIMHRPARD